MLFHSQLFFQSLTVFSRIHACLYLAGYVLNNKGLTLMFKQKSSQMATQYNTTIIRPTTFLHLKTSLHSFILMFFLVQLWED